jgi:hypothetical protein
MAARTMATLHLPLRHQERLHWDFLYLFLVLLHGPYLDLEEQVGKVTFHQIVLVSANPAMQLLIM